MCVYLCGFLCAYMNACCMLRQQRKKSTSHFFFWNGQLVVQLGQLVLLTNHMTNFDLSKLQFLKKLVVGLVGKLNIFSLLL